jgi:hypothetical protein
VLVGTALIVNNLFTHAARAGTYSAYAHMSFGETDSTGFAQLALNPIAGKSELCMHPSIESKG